jgi:voltage-gated potassium channel
MLEKAEPGDKVSLVFDWGLIILIVLNIVAVILNSFESLRMRYADWFSLFELVSIVPFTIEYLLRIWTADLKYPGKSRISSIFSFVFSALGIIDLCSILPFYLPLTTAVDLRVLRILRLAKTLRILKIGRYSPSIALIVRVLKRCRSDLLVTLFVTMMLVLLASALMYSVENQAQPEQFPDIVATTWWTIVTLTTVGYGDVYPITALGKVIGGFIALLGIGLVALPTGIISSGFMEEIRLRNSKRICPHCGLPIDDPNPVPQKPLQSS